MEQDKSQPDSQHRPTSPDQPMTLPERPGKSDAVTMPSQVPPESEAPDKALTGRIRGLALERLLEALLEGRLSPGDLLKVLALSAPEGPQTGDFVIRLVD